MRNEAVISTTDGAIRILRAKNGWLIAKYDPWEIGGCAAPIQMVAETPERLSEIVVDWAKRQEAT